MPACPPAIAAGTHRAGPCGEGATPAATATMTLDTKRTGEPCRDPGARIASALRGRLRASAPLDQLVPLGRQLVGPPRPLP